LKTKKSVDSVACSQNPCPLDAVRETILHIIIIVIIIIIIIFVITFMHGIYYYVLETIHVSRVYNIAAILYLLFVLHVMLFCT